MTRCVVDASVAVKWLVPEIHSAAAARLLAEDREILAPDLLWSECGNTLWKKWRRQELSADEVGELLQDLRRFPLQIFSSDALYEPAWKIASRLERSFYDSFYIALAAARSCPLVTADLRLYNALRRRREAFELVWVEELAR